MLTGAAALHTVHAEHDAKEAGVWCHGKVGCLGMVLVWCMTAVGAPLGTTTVYRCGTRDYAQLPCASVEGHAVVVDGEVSGERQAQAWAVAQRQAREARGVGRGRLSVRQAPPPKAIVIPVRPVSVGPQAPLSGSNGASSRGAKRSKGAQHSPTSQAPSHSAAGETFMAKVPGAPKAASLPTQR